MKTVGVIGGMGPVPIDLHAGDGARGDSRAAFKVLCGNAGQSQPAHPIAGFFPSLTRDAQHGGLAGPGIADHDSEVPSKPAAQRGQIWTPIDNLLATFEDECGIERPYARGPAFP
jgi:hypothetical protein